MRLCHGLLGKNDVWVVSQGALQHLPDPARAVLVHKDSACIWSHPDQPGLITKLFMLKIVARDALRRYWSSQAKRTLHASVKMQQMGFETPEIIGYGVCLALWRRWDSLLFMRRLPPHETVRAFLNRCDDQAAREAALGRIAAGVAAIYAAGFHHKDCHLDNILRRQDGQLIWIDAELRRTSRAEIQADRLRLTLHRLRTMRPAVVSQAEWQRFADLIDAGLGANAWQRAVTDHALAVFHAELADQTP